MRVLICGGRNFNDWGVFYPTIALFQARHGDITEIIHGGARGADTMAGDVASDRGIPVRVFPADWTKHGKSAGAIRNQQMLNVGKPDWVIAFPGGVGTADMVRRAKRAGVPILSPQEARQEKEETR